MTCHYGLVFPLRFISKRTIEAMRKMPAKGGRSAKLSSGQKRPFGLCQKENGKKGK